MPVTTQGRTLAAAKRNLREVEELHLETWGEPKGAKQAHDVYVTSMEVGAGAGIYLRFPAVN